MNTKCLCSQNTLTAMVSRSKQSSGTVGAVPSGTVGYTGEPCAITGWCSGDGEVCENGYCMPGQTGGGGGPAGDPGTSFTTPGGGGGGGSPGIFTPPPKTGGGGGGTATATCPPGQVKLDGKCVDDPALKVDEGVSPWWFVGGLGAVGVVIGGIYAVKKSRKGR